MNTSQSDVIKNCRHDLQKERIIKSVLCGMAVGFAVMFVVAFVMWTLAYKGLWWSLGLGAAAWIGGALLFYFAIFTFSDIDVMKRIDRAGLDERMITMYQLQGDQSYMAQRQREDAAAAFGTAVKASGGRLIKTKIATAIICVASIVCPFGAGMAVVTGLSDYDVIPTLDELISGDGWGGNGGLTTPTFTVTYKVGVTADGKTIDVGNFDGGTVSVGDAEEGYVFASSSNDNATDSVVKGGSSSAKALIADGYYVAKWVDENGKEYFPNPANGCQPFTFSADNIQKNMTVTVVFAKYDNEPDLGYSYYYDPDNKNNPDDNDPNDPEDNSENENPPDMPDPDDSPAPPLGSTGGGNPAKPGNAIIDGETQYGENYEYFHQIAMDILANGTDGYPPELIAALEAYFGILL